MDLINVEPTVRVALLHCSVDTFSGAFFIVIFGLQKLRFSIAGASSQLPPIINCVILPLNGGIGLAKLLCVSAEYCEKNLPLLINLIDKNTNFLDRGLNDADAASSVHV